MSDEITQKHLKEIMDYDQESGMLFWKIKRSRGVMVGDLVGYINPNGYWFTQIYGDKYLCHRLIWLYMTGEWPIQIDHLDHVRSNNKWVNLREVTLQENLKNLKMASNNKSGLTGVWWNKVNNKWNSAIGVKKKPVFLGSFDNIFDAACARKSAEVKHGYHENHGVRKELCQKNV